MDDAWPYTVVTERSQVLRPRSLGICLELGERAEAEVVLYAGGWADVHLIPPSATEIESEYVELDDADEFGALLDGVVSRLQPSS